MSLASKGMVVNLSWPSVDGGRVERPCPLCEWRRMLYVVLFPFSLRGEDGMDGRSRKKGMTRPHIDQSVSKELAKTIHGAEGEVMRVTACIS